MFEPEVFRKQMYYTEVLVTLLALFGAWGIVPLAPRRYAPDYCAQRRAPPNHALTRGIREPFAQGRRQRGAQWCPPHLKSVSPISRLAHRLLHPSNSVF